MELCRTIDGRTTENSVPGFFSGYEKFLIFWVTFLPTRTRECVAKLNLSKRTFSRSEEKPKPKQGTKDERLERTSGAWIAG